MRVQACTWRAPSRTRAAMRVHARMRRVDRDTGEHVALKVIDLEDV